MIRFRPQDRPDGSETAIEADDEEEQRIREWQCERLAHLGYRTATATMIVADAWMSGEHTDLVHRIESLLDKGATREQAARIVVPVSELCSDAA